MSVTAHEYCKLTGCDPSVATRALQDAGEKLFNRQLTLQWFDKEKNDDVKSIIRWVQRVDYYNGTGKISFRFSKDIAPYVNQLNDNFTSYSLSEVGFLGSVYAVRFYELIAQYRKIGHRIISIEELRKILKLEDKYTQYSDLKRRVIQLAVNQVNQVNQINEFTFYFLTIEEIKEVRTVVAIKLIFKKKSADKIP